jgi:hypothetical protein
MRRQYKQLDSAHSSLLERERGLKERTSKAEAMVVDLEKARRVLESELQALRSRQIESDGRLAETSRAKEVIEQSLAFVGLDGSYFYFIRFWNDNFTLLRPNIMRSRIRFCRWKEMLMLANASWKP